MKRNISIQLRAAFLLVVFGLNMAVGFACVIGVDMVFNTSHHHDEVATKVHVHSNWKKHEHHNENNKHQHDGKESSKKDDCCNDKVVKLSQSDKAVPQTSTLINPGLFTTFISSCYNIDVLFTSHVNTNKKYLVRNHHPPIPDIRIAIQSFQI